ncbi:hypothetical protein [Robiginitalea sp.]|uniref:hypothetical protein n=1 Tax=Robiginitalea sp. TaxID=1902411 RepID=UPI003C72B85C
MKSLFDSAACTEILERLRKPERGIPLDPSQTFLKVAGASLGPGPFHNGLKVFRTGRSQKT